ncbi:FAD-binding domain-containing protein [Hypoxylon sp. FL0543]|nr:FAD-binding domain-containing protein [Hypoxylon sp. FL0543]
MERHRQAVRLVSSSVRAFFERGEPYRIWHGSTNSTRPPHQKAGARAVDISALGDVLSVDAARRVALVEPNVPMDRLVESTLAHGLVPPVVMEFPGITAGGGFAGTAGESSSFKHGYFDENVRGVEVVLPDGEVVFARPEGGDGAYEDLFRGAAGALGTLGVATLLELRLIEAKRFVRTTYRRTSSVAEAVRVVREECASEKGNDYVDGILFSKDHGVIVSGQMTNELPEGESIQTFSRAWDPWFYMHVRDLTKGLPSSASSASSSSSPSNSTPTSPTSPEGTVTEYIPLAEYLFRYDRGGFWVGAAAFDYFRPVPFTRFFRWLLDDFLHTRMLYRALHGSGESARFVVQDVGMPYESAEPFVDYVSENLDIWPLWLCPLKTPRGPTFHPHLRAGGTEGQGQGQGEVGEMLNIGVWGWGPNDRDAFVRANRDLERRVDELGGMKWLYAHTYYSEPEFWRAYGGHRAEYEALRQKYRATSLPSVYDKVRVKVDAAGDRGWKPWLKSLWPVGGLVGIWKGIRSKDYMLHRNATWKWIGDEKAGKTKVA